MRDRGFVDTNVLVYLFDADAPGKRERARRIIETEGPSGTAFLSTQVLQEFYVSVTRKLARPLPPEDAERAVQGLAALPVVHVDVQMILGAISTSRLERLSFWDALIVRAAIEARCRRLWTEDLQHGRRFGDLEVVNPFLS